MDDVREMIDKDGGVHVLQDVAGVPNVVLLEMSASRTEGGRSGTGVHYVGVARRWLVATRFGEGADARWGGVVWRRVGRIASGVVAEEDFDAAAGAEEGMFFLLRATFLWACFYRFLVAAAMVG